MLNAFLDEEKLLYNLLVLHSRISKILNISALLFHLHELLEQFLLIRDQLLLGRVFHKIVQKYLSFFDFDNSINNLANIIKFYQL
jgi:hypothetical protein